MVLICVCVDQVKLTKTEMQNDEEKKLQKEIEQKQKEGKAPNSVQGLLSMMQVRCNVFSNEYLYRVLHV